MLSAHSIGIFSAGLQTLALASGSNTLWVEGLASAIEPDFHPLLEDPAACGQTLEQLRQGAPVTRHGPRPLWEALLGRWLPPPPPLAITDRNLSGRQWDFSRKPERANKLLAVHWSPNATLANLLSTLLVGVPGIHVMSLQTIRLLGLFQLHLTLSDDSGRKAGVLSHMFVIDQGKPSHMYRHDGFVTVEPHLRTGGIGTSLFVNFIRWLYKIDYISSYRMIVDGLGRVAWSRLEGLQVAPQTLEDFRQRIRALNDEFQLGIDPGEIASLSSLQEVGRFRIPQEAPEGLIRLAQKLYSPLNVEITPTDLARRARKVGDIALLQEPYDASLDLSSDSADAERFFASTLKVLQ